MNTVNIRRSRVIAASCMAILLCHLPLQSPSRVVAQAPPAQQPATEAEAPEAEAGAEAPEAVATVDAAEDQQPTVREGFGNLLNALGIGRRPVARPADAVDTFEMVAPMEVQIPEPPDSEMEKREARLTAYTNAMCLWLIATCQLSEEQVEAVRTLLAEEVASEQELYRRSKDLQARQQPFYDYSIIRFREPQGAAWRFSRPAFEKKLLALLTDEQRSVYTEQAKARELRHHQSFLNYLLVQVDSELYLSTRQRTTFAQQLEKGLGTLRNSLYSFSPQTYYLQFTSLSSALARVPNSAYNEAQQARATDLITSGTNNSSDRHLTFMSNDGVDAWYRQLDDAAVKQTSLFAAATSVRVAFYEDEMGLTPEQSRYLTVAGKGATMKAIAEWKKSTAVNLDQWVERIPQFGGGNFGFGVQAANLNILDTHTIWTTALKDVTADGNDVMKTRQAWRRQMTADSIFAMLDQELWLRDEQIDPMQELILNAIPTSGTKENDNEYIREIYLIAIPLFKIDDDKINRILDEDQQTAWKELKSLYGNNGNYLTVNMREGGQFSFALP